MYSKFSILIIVTIALVIACTSEKKDVLNKVESVSADKDSLDSKQSISGFFTGTKKFCDEEGYWYFLVTIDGNNIVLKSFPGENNTYHSDKTTPKK
ncbi:MAG: hypothetical protein IPK10_17485 [Bacteroidetes bacterium]|nr:hypothetical protein [Bacteroidota bacterium]